MASFRKRGKKWQYTVELGTDPVTGKRKQAIKGGFQTKKLAELAAADIERQVNDGTYVIPTDITFSEFAEQWLTYYRKLVKPSTVDARVTSIGRLNEHMKHAPMAKITRRFYTNFLHKLHDGGAPKNTIMSIHSTARMIFKHALHEERVISTNPTEGIDLRFLEVRTQTDLKDNEKFLEKEDLVKFLNVCKDRYEEHPQNYIVFLMLAYTGLRRGELSVLKWTDVDLENHTISVTKTFAYGKSKRMNDISLSSPKTTESYRTIDIDEFVVKRLKEHRLWQKEYMMKNRDVYEDMGFVFVNTYKYPGHPMPPQNIYYQMKMILKEMKYPHDLSPHSMRHTHASLCIEAEIPLRDIAERLGQSDTRTLERIYAHTTKAQREKVATRFNTLMEKLRADTPF